MQVQQQLMGPRDTTAWKLLLWIKQLLLSSDMQIMTQLRSFSVGVDKLWSFGSIFLDVFMPHTKPSHIAMDAGRLFLSDWKTENRRGGGFFIFYFAQENWYFFNIVLLLFLGLRFGPSNTIFRHVERHQEWFQGIGAWLWGFIKTRKRVFFIKVRM